jgi:hypothetical protein
MDTRKPLLKDFVSDKPDYAQKDLPTKKPKIGPTGFFGWLTFSWVNPVLEVNSETI